MTSYTKHLSQHFSKICRVFFGLSFVMRSYLQNSKQRAKFNAVHTHWLSIHCGVQQEKLPKHLYNTINFMPERCKSYSWELVSLFVCCCTSQHAHDICPAHGQESRPYSLFYSRTNLHITLKYGSNSKYIGLYNAMF